MSKRSYSYTVCERFGKHGRWTIDKQLDGTVWLLLNGRVQFENIETVEDAKDFVEHAEETTC